MKTKRNCGEGSEFNVLRVSQWTFPFFQIMNAFDDTQQKMLNVFVIFVWF